MGSISGGRGERATGQVAVAGCGFQTVPPAVPVPCDRPTARGAVRGATRGSVVAAAIKRLYGLPAVQRGLDTARSLVDDVWDEVIASERGPVGDLDPINEPSCSTMHGHCRLATTGSRTPRGSIRRAVNSAWRSNWPTVPCSAVTSTGLTSRPVVNCGSWIQDRQGPARSVGASRLRRCFG